MFSLRNGSKKREAKPYTWAEMQRVLQEHTKTRSPPPRSPSPAPSVSTRSPSPAPSAMSVSSEPASESPVPRLNLGFSSPGPFEALTSSRKSRSVLLPFEDAETSFECTPSISIDPSIELAYEEADTIPECSPMISIPSVESPMDSVVECPGTPSTSPRAAFIDPSIEFAFDTRSECSRAPSIDSEMELAMDSAFDHLEALSVCSHAPSVDSEIASVHSEGLSVCSRATSVDLDMPIVDDMHQSVDPILHKPVVKHPANEVTKEEWHSFVKEHYQQNLKGHDTDPEAAMSKASHIILKSMRIESRWFVRKLEDLNKILDPQTQSDMMIKHGVPLGLSAVDEALAQAGMEARDIGAIFFTTHNPYPFPALSSYIMSERDFPYDCQHFPFQTYGCAGGGVCLGLASDWVRAHPGKNALVVCVELSSLGFRPHKKGMSWFINSSLFGDGAAACVIQGARAVLRGAHPGQAPSTQLTARIKAQKQHTVPRSEAAMYYEYDSMGYNFRVDPTIIKQVVSGVSEFIEGFVEESFGRTKAAELEHVCIHPGGAKIVSGIYGGLGLNGTKSEAHCYGALSEGGNRSSVTVMDILSRSWDHAAHGEQGVVIGMGVGFIMGGIAMRFEGPTE